MTPSDKTRLAWSAGLALLGAVAAASMFGFTVDDAWISVRYARHLASGAGYRFNVGGDITDGVTPLVFPWLLVPLAKGAPLEVLERVKVVGVVVWSLTAGLLGRRIAASPAALIDRLLAALLVVIAVPLAAHAASGMETPLATGLATCAACMMHRPRLAAVLAGMAALFRPELVVWAASFALGAEFAARRRIAPVARAVPSAVVNALLASAPFLLVVVARMVVFGRPGPLALVAKPADLAQGLLYLVASAAALTPIVAFAPRAAARAGGRAAVLGAAAVAHCVAVAFVGGDWMPYARLFVPIAPGLALVACDSGPFASAWARALRGGLALAYGVFLLLGAAPVGRRVGEHRHALAERARPWLEGLGSVAAVDIGWPSSVFEGTLVDLAGLTDPAIAALPGSHTSKRVDAALLLDRRPDALLFYAERRPGDPWNEVRYMHLVERRLATSELVEKHYVPRTYLPLVGDKGYVLWMRRE